MPAAEVLSITRHEWAEKAASARRSRIRSGWVSSSVGALLLGFGATVAIADLGFPFRELSTKDRATFASLMVTIGSLNLSSALRLLLVEDPIEAGWHGFTALHPTSWLERTHFQMALQPKGASLTARGFF